MTDWNLPTVDSLYTDVIAEFKARDDDTAKLFDGTTSSNLPVGTIRWNSTNKRFEKYDGSSWAELEAQYAINVDKLNGQLASYYTDISNVSAGTLPAGHFNDTSHGNLSGGSLHAVATPSTDGFMSSTDKSKLDGIEAGATGDQTASEILTLLKTVDGSGSGLDADLLDGNDSTLFSRKVYTTLDTSTTAPQWSKVATISLSNQGDECNFTLHIASFNTDTNSTENLVANFKVRQVLTFGNDPNVYLEQYSLDTTSISLGYIITSNAGPSTIDIYSKISNTNTRTYAFIDNNSTNISNCTFLTDDPLTTTEPTSIAYGNINTVWHSGNDGSGSGLDADTLDGNEATVFATKVTGATADNIATLDASGNLQDGGSSVTDLQPNGELRSIKVFTSSGTWTKPAGLKRIKVIVTGGGGSGGVHISNIGGGGGAGGTAIKLIEAASLGSTETVTIGAGGAKVISAVNGNTGGTSSFGSHCSATGGVGGYGGNAWSGGPSGHGIGGNINLNGGRGGIGSSMETTGGDAGESYWGGAGSTYGAIGFNGSGSAGSNTSTGAGKGGNGLVYIEEYF